MTDRVWVVLVTGDVDLEVPPEVFVDEGIASRCAEQWAWFLSSTGRFRIVRPGDGRIQVGRWDVRLVPAGFPESSAAEWWIGTSWPPGAYPDPEVVVLPGRDAAKAWIELEGKWPTSEVTRTRWRISASSPSQQRSSRRAHAAKFVAEPPSLS